MYAAEVQRLTTAPPRRHAPRLFLPEALVANLGTIGVSRGNPGRTVGPHGALGGTCGRLRGAFRGLPGAFGGRPGRIRVILCDCGRL
ncbi:hypothetical protein GTY84_00690 [Streptomyces sp. SID8352]|nr:hypothetical protein [Streptomyces sp. SID8352]